MLGDDVSCEWRINLEFWRFELSAMFWLVEQNEPIKEEKKRSIIIKN
jgi:hypothetical protein